MNNTEGRLLILFYATGRYLDFYRDCIPTLGRVLPKTEKVVIVITDKDLSEVKELFTEAAMLSLHIVDITTTYIDQLDRMEMLCLKPWAIQKALKEHSSWLEDLGVDKAMYIDSSFRFHKGIQDWMFSRGRISLFQHFLWDIISEGDRASLHNKVDKSFSYIPIGGRRMYVHAGLFWGYYFEFTTLINQMTDLMGKELKNWTVPTWHDESVLNKLYNDDPMSFWVFGNMGDYDAPWRTNGVENSIVAFVDNH